METVRPLIGNIKNIIQSSLDRGNTYRNSLALRIIDYMKEDFDISKLPGITNDFPYRTFNRDKYLEVSKQVFIFNYDVTIAYNIVFSKKNDTDYVISKIFNIFKNSSPLFHGGKEDKIEVDFNSVDVDFQKIEDFLLDRNKTKQTFVNSCNNYLSVLRDDITEIRMNYSVGRLKSIEKAESIINEYNTLVKMREYARHL